jgi:hypothetical protein
MTFSADGTGHRNINYAARHVNLKVDSYTNDGNGEGRQATRLLGLESTLDGSSEQSVKGWKDLLGDIAEIYNQSPLGQRTGNFLRTVDIFVKLSGMHTDHCAKEKKDASLLQKEKQLATYQSLGEDAILESSNQELLPHFMQARAQMLKAVGGERKWIQFSEIERADKEAVMMEQLVIKLGKDSYEKLSNDEKRILKLFIWAGCGCHKDLNTVRGGNAAMMAWWDENKVDPPVLLANRDNAAVLKDVSQSDVATPAQERALQMTTRGGVKATQLAGEIFNNKNDKRGEHEIFRAWWKENVGPVITFPDTSNTRFQSHCEAASMLLEHLPHFIRFLIYVKEKKQDRCFNHMEGNLWKALHCTQTKTELAVLALYAQAITHPYMRVIRAPGQTVNMLDLGPLHQKVRQHIQRIMEDPKFLIGPNVVSETGAMDGQPWHAPKAFQAIQRLLPQLPYLEKVLVAFFKGAYETWKRFTSEFAPGGLIDEATEEEKELAWMPATNDVNEGALGSFRVLMRRQPQLTLLQYNAQAMYSRNGTQAFMNKKFEPEDYQFIHQKARSDDSREHERMRKKQIIEHTQAKIDKRTGALAVKRKKAEETADKVAAVKLVFDKGGIPNIKGEKLKLQLMAFQKAGAPNLKDMSANTRVVQIREGLQAAIDLYKSGQWKPIETLEASDESDSQEEIDIQVGNSEDENDWEDTDDDR